ncbi:hypothetical protein EDEG_02541 [Edhazardia aedis USNM 41457]|uniref:Helicase C-terminal domain-containing protein n=1 Tax=Edhazardia aedis (strain USNM 41457) TaxID=1003232 RepID=J9DNZ3_EDHAE|nr:hypothetical protein EDEG_02541 [Edhazardia aedis USNM 41457]|eukprot:EJW03062.1 hypothetical protein EDEG_02541 [Edhazardia aedis USNM 41457]
MQPRKFFKSNLITKKDVTEYEAYICEKIQNWIKNDVITSEEVKKIYDHLVKSTNDAFDQTEKPRELIKRLYEEKQQAIKRKNEELGVFTSAIQSFENKQISTIQNNKDDTSKSANNISAFRNIQNASDVSLSSCGIQDDADYGDISSVSTFMLGESTIQESSIHNDLASTINRIKINNDREENTNINANGNVDIGNNAKNVEDAFTLYNNQTHVYISEYNMLEEDIVELCETLKKKKMLPCIIFNMDRTICNKLAIKLYNHLEEQENLETVDKQQEKARSKILKEMQRTRDDKPKLKKDAWIEESKLEEENMALLKKEKKNIKFCYVDPVFKKSDYEVQEVFCKVKKTDPVYLDMIYRGIGLHHNGMNKKYRFAVENLFRLKHLQIVFSTETLSLGINMPCKTVVFAGDNIQLDAINFKQMAGRAGRRGYDTLGNVVFYKIGKNKVQNLLMSGLPEIRGKYDYSNGSFVGFTNNYVNSIIQSPLYSLMYENNNNDTPNENDINSSNIIFSIDNSCKLPFSPNDYNLGDFFLNYNSRKNLVNSQINTLNALKFVLNDNHNAFTDLFLSNKTTDPEIFAFTLLFKEIIRTQTAVEDTEFMLLLSHFINIKYTKDTFQYGILEDLPSKFQSFVDKINESYKIGLKGLLNPNLEFLQNQCTEPLFKLGSFMYNDNYPKNYFKNTDKKINRYNKNELVSLLENKLKQKDTTEPTYDTPLSFKNSYILDFYVHGRPDLIKSVNKIEIGDLYYNLDIVNDLLKRCLTIMETYKFNAPVIKTLRIINTNFSTYFERFKA